MTVTPGYEGLGVIALIVSSYFIYNTVARESLSRQILPVVAIVWLVAFVYLLNRLLEGWKPFSSTKTRGELSQYPYDWDSIRNEALVRDGYKCGNCSSSDNLHVHHIIPVSKGGSSELGNLRTLCEDCHKLLHPHMQ